MDLAADCTSNLVVDKLFSVAEDGNYVAVHELLDRFEHRFHSLANERDLDDDTPLIVSAMAGRLQVVEVLLARGARVNTAGCSGRTALHCAAFEGRVDVVERLLQCADILVAIEDSICETPLHKAASNGHLRIVQLLLASMRAKADAVAFRTYSRPHRLSQGEATFYRLLDRQNFLGCTALHNAAQHSHLAVVEALLNHGADIQSTDVFDLTPLQLVENLMHADSEKRFACIALLREHLRLRVHGADADVDQ
jgi:ankyrin repeat protein